MDCTGPEAVARRFGTEGPPQRVVPHPGGHIHETWMVTAGSSEFVLQRINTMVFQDPILMMENVMRVTSHLSQWARRRGVDPKRCPAQVLAARDGGLLVYDDEVRPWRAFRRVPRAVSHTVVTSAAAAWEVGRAFGRFFADVQDLPGPPLEEPIAGFKDFSRRKADFEFLIDLDPFGRADSCRRDIENVRHYHRLIKALDAALDSGRLPQRIVHNDAKAANALLDEETGEAVCVVDLDTVAPGVVLFDVGDLLRSATITLAEDGDPATIGVRDNQIEAALGGYLAEAGPLLTDGERDLIPLAGPLMAYESAMRFLTDYLAGDVYFRISSPRHNLDRTRAQVRILEALDRAGDRVAALVDAGSG
ncbi:MAG TPA: aminoglycoside phosphotransferase family protein [Acidimicrobiales bacterium]